MTIDSIGLLAQQSYLQIQDRPKMHVSPSETSSGQAVSLHQMVDKQFNSFAKMTPEQILNRIKSSGQHNSFVSNSSSRSASTNILSSATSALRAKIAQQENTARKSLIGQDSLVDLLTTTTEAKNAMDATVRVRDKFLEAFDKVMNMNM